MINGQMKILVTGGAGYIGSILVPMLLEKTGHMVTVLDNFMFGQAPLNHVCAHPRFNVIRGDVRDLALLKAILPEFDFIIPLAARVGARLCDEDPDAARATNWLAIETMVHLAPHARVIAPITNSGYGIGQGGKPCTEESPMKPISLYGETKVRAEMLILNAGGVSLRLATVFGMSPRMRIDLLVNEFVYRAVTDRALTLFEGHFRRNYIHVRDVALAFLHAITHYDEMSGQAYNVGLSNANLTKRELCEEIRRQVPAFTFLEAPIGEDPDKRDYIVSNAKIEATGFKPVWGLDYGIAELIKGFRMIRNTRYGNA